MARTNVILPEDLIREVDRIAGKRKRSRFIVEAIEERLDRMRLLAALEQAAGAWGDEHYGDLDSQVALNAWLDELRRRAGERSRKS